MVFDNLTIGGLLVAGLALGVLIGAAISCARSPNCRLRL